MDKKSQGELSPSDTAEMTAFQWMSRQPNYRTMRACRRIEEAWGQLPLFKLLDGESKFEPGIISQSVGFIRRVFDDGVGSGDEPPFNSSMVRAKRFEKPQIKEILDEAKKYENEFNQYLNVVEKRNSEHPTVRRATRYFRELLNSPDQGESELGDSLGRERIYHHGIELYRRLPYTKVLNHFVHPILSPADDPSDAPKALLCDAAWRWTRDENAEANFEEEPLPRFVALSGKPTLVTDLNKQEDFEPWEVNNPELKKIVRYWHKTWFREVEKVGDRKAPDFFVLTIPVREGWQGDRPYGTYLGHLALFLRRDRFFDKSKGDYDEQGRLKRMSELDPTRRANVWAQMIRFHEGLVAFLNEEQCEASMDNASDNWFAELFSKPEVGKLHWEAMKRDLDDFVEAHYESEFDAWLDIEFSKSADHHAHVSTALSDVAKWTDGWTQTDCSEQQIQDDPIPKDMNRDAYKEYKNRVDKYKDYFVPSPSGDFILLKLRSEIREPGESPDREFKFCLEKNHDTIIPKIEKEDEGRTRIAYYRRIWKRYNHLYQRYLRRAEIAEKGQQSGLLEAAHDYSKDIDEIHSLLDNYSNELDQNLNEVAELISGGCNADKIQPVLDRIKAPVESANYLAEFMFMHLKAKNGRLEERPKICSDWVRVGSADSMRWLMNTLVWIPHRELNETLQRSAEPSRSMRNFGRVFAYEDQIHDTPSNSLLLGNSLLRLAKDFGVTHSKDFDSVFKAPDIILKGANGATVYKDPRGTPEFPPGLMPLLVWSLRAAVRHSFASELFNVLEPGWERKEHKCPAIHVSAGWEKDDEKSFAWCVRFQIPERLVSEGKDNVLPLGDWHQILDMWSSVSVWNWRIEKTKESTTTRIIRIHL